MFYLFVSIGIALFLTGVLLISHTVFAPKTQKNTYPKTKEVEENISVNISRRSDNSRRKDADALRAYRQEVTTLRETLQNTNNRLLSTHKTLEQKEASIVELVLSAQKRKTRMEELTKERDSLIETLSTVQKEKTTVQNKVSALEGEIATTRISIHEKAKKANATLQKKTDILEENCVALMDQNRQLDEEVLSYKQKIDSLQEAFSGSQEYLENKEKTIAELIETVKEKQSVLQELVKNRDGLARTLTKTQGQKQLLEDQVRSLQDELGKKDEDTKELNAYKQQSTLLKKRIQNLAQDGSKSDELLAELERHRKLLLEKEEELARLRKHIFPPEGQAKEDKEKVEQKVEQKIEQGKASQEIDKMKMILSMLNDQPK